MCAVGHPFVDKDITHFEMSGYSKPRERFCPKSLRFHVLRSVNLSAGWFWRMYPRSGFWYRRFVFLYPRSGFWYRRSFFLYPCSGFGGPGNIRQNHPFVEIPPAGHVQECFMGNPRKCSGEWFRSAFWGLCKCPGSAPESAFPSFFNKENHSWEHSLGHSQLLAGHSRKHSLGTFWESPRRTPKALAGALDGRNRARVIAESLARVIAAIRITSVRWQSYLPLQTQNLVLVDAAFVASRFKSRDWRSLL